MNQRWILLLILVGVNSGCILGSRIKPIIIKNNSRQIISVSLEENEILGTLQPFEEKRFSGGYLSESVLTYKFFDKNLKVIGSGVLDSQKMRDRQRSGTLVLEFPVGIR